MPKSPKEIMTDIEKRFKLPRLSSLVTEDKADKDVEVPPPSVSELMDGLEKPDIPPMPEHLKGGE